MAIRADLDAVGSLDQDRILRSYLTLIQATTAHVVLPAAGADRGRRRAAEVVRGVQARPAGDPRPPGAPAAVRDIRVLASVRGRASAIRRGGARRAALVGPAGGLPDRGAGSGQGADGEERGHRAGRREGRVRAQAGASRLGPRRVPGRGSGRLQAVHLGHARRDRQHRRGISGAAGGRRAPRRRRPLPGGRGGQGHGDVLRHRERDLEVVRVLAG